MSGGHTQLEVLAVGDTVIDAFINMDENYGHTYANEDGKWLAVPFATKIPFSSSEIIEGVGNAANAAVSMSRLGLRSGLVANVGHDAYGREVISALQKNGVDTRFVRQNVGKKTNYHYVLWFGEERTILINHEKYEYDWPRLRKSEVPKWIYLSSIAENAVEFHDDLADWLDDNPEVRMAFQPGTYQMKFGAERLKRIYKRTEVLILNREEAVIVGGGDKHDIKDLFRRLHDLGPKIVVITDGPKGAYASAPEGQFKMPNYPDPKPPLERTGAGDAFASTFVAALIRGNPVEGALQAAPINSMNVVQHVGAQAGLLKGREIDELLEKAPEHYVPERI